MPFDLDVFVRGQQHSALPVSLRSKYIFELLRQANIDRINPLITDIHYPFKYSGVDPAAARKIAILPPRHFPALFDVFGYLAQQNFAPAIIHDGLEFLIRYRPFLGAENQEVVIGFPGMTRLRCGRSWSGCDNDHFPIIGISHREIFLDEVPTGIGWQSHWWIAGIHT